MGSSVAPSNYISPPDVTLQAAELGMQADIGRQQVANKDRLLGYAAQMPLESWTPDIWGQSGMQNKAAQIAAINSFKSRQLEQQFNPQMAQLRQQLPQMMIEDASGNGWQKQMNDWAKHAGLTKMLASGMQDSTVGKSAFFDDATIQGQAMKQAQMQRAAALVGANPSPQVGLDAASILGAEQAGGAQNLQQRAAFRNALQGQTQAAAQGTTDWINKMMQSTNSASEGYRKDWQNYQQAMLDGAQKNADRQNALVGAGIQAAGSIAGGAMGMCWVAREVYGTKTGTWKVFRYWLLNEAPAPILNLYAKYGERAAAFIANKPTLKLAVRLLMDKIIQTQLVR
jgi:hypothetical protein